MRRVSLRLVPLVLVVLVALGGWSSAASASDAGLRALVGQQRAAEKRTSATIERASDRIGRPSTLAQYRRRFGPYLEVVARSFRREAATEDRYRARFGAEAPETEQSTRGRSLVVLGLRDGASALRSIAGRLVVVRRKLRRVRTVAQLERFGKVLDRAYASRIGSRGDRRLRRGRTLIRNAPAVPAPAPAPPATPAPPAAPPAVTPPAPPSLLPGLL